MLQIIKNLKKSKNSGMTLIELVVTIAVLAIASSILVSSYTNVLEDQRQQSDLAQFENVDIALKQIMFYDDAFAEIKPLMTNRTRFAIDCELERTPNGKGRINLANATINGTAVRLCDQCPIIYGYLIEQIDDPIIDMTSSSYRDGYYRIYIEFNKTQVSSVRDPGITNDTVIVTNTGFSEMLPD